MAPLEIQEDEMQIPPREKVEGLEVYMTPRVDPKEYKQKYLCAGYASGRCIGVVS